MQYKDCKPITHKCCTAWTVETKEGKRLLLFSPDAELVDVHYYCKTRFKEFTLGVVSVGDFPLDKVDSSYSPDARRVNQDWEVIV